MRWWLLFSAAAVVFIDGGFDGGDGDGSDGSRRTVYRINMTTAKESTKTWSNSVRMWVNVSGECAAVSFANHWMHASNVLFLAFVMRKLSVCDIVCSIQLYYIWVCRNNSASMYSIWWSIFWKLSFHSVAPDVGSTDWWPCAHSGAIFLNVERFLSHWDYLCVCFLSAYSTFSFFHCRSAHTHNNNDDDGTSTMFNRIQAHVGFGCCCSWCFSFLERKNRLWMLDKLFANKQYQLD